MIIDCHTHAFLPEDLEVLGGRLAEFDSCLEDRDPNKWQIYASGDLAGGLALQEEAGVDRFVVLPITARAARVGELNRHMAQAARENPAVIPFGVLHPAGAVEEDLAEALSLGMRGIKLHAFVQRFMLGTPESGRMLGLIAESGLPVLMDSMYIPGLLAAKPHLDWMVEMYGPFGAGPAEIAAAARAHPTLKIIAAHVGGLYGWDQLDPLMELDNVAFDISYVMGLLPPAELVAIIRRKGAEKVCYGTDSPWRRPKVYRRWFEELPLSPAEREEVAFAAFARLTPGI